jgi:hypothetical protein
MQLYPQDLSDNDHARLIQKRAMTASGTAAAYDPNAPLPEPKLGKLGRLWAKGLGMTDRQAAVGNANASSWTQGTGWGTAIFGPFLTGLIVLIMAKKHGLDPNIAWASFGAATAGFSAMGFGPFAEADIRAAVEALGEAIEKLPRVRVEPFDTAALRLEAAQLQQQALTEPDRVTADSISRRADALERRAEAHEHSALLAKRAAALRAEILAQIETLREGLAGHQLEDGVGPTVAFAELSDTARRVAQEASAAAEARQELAQVQRLGG